MNADRQALLNLVDAVSEVIARAPEEELRREVAEDHGHARALADDFDRILEPLLAPVARPAAPPRWHEALLEGLAGLLSPGRLAFAGAAALCVLVAASLTVSPRLR